MTVRLRMTDRVTAPSNDVAYYAQLEAGARFLAAEADSRDERDEHLMMVHRYRRLGMEAREAAR